MPHCKGKEGTCSAKGRHLDGTGMDSLLSYDITIATYMTGLLVADVGLHIGLSYSTPHFL